ncbi:efflux RND transporter periplasmic adaptor subunit [Desulfolutivibrio sulfoxidireducens]|uniref:efflux RND transporter periplasmic adaptor subunit n=1 Tax=Desulfolutivibrio sulfoxidireducens TaxID=2773299 RepID=UPI001FE71FF2|nr:efflux RND transporter periplasmic adaptor subunit [Desulfolutivibrio sulfoxidireducens]
MTTQAVDAPLNVDGVGHVYALNTVKVRAQVTGYIKETFFREGQEVAAGDRLILIDPAPFKAKVDEARATLLRDRATAEQNRRDWLRYKDLVQKAVISQEDYEQKRTEYQQAREQVRVDEAALDDAEINLSWCSINSPVDGVCSLQQVKTGNLVEANKDTILTVTQITPINVQMAVAEKTLPDIRQYAATGRLPLDVRYSGRNEVAARCQLTVINNTVDTTTGMITIQAECANADKKLWPGQFVDGTLVLTMIPGTVLVPSDALLTTQDGTKAFVIKADDTVEMRKLTIGRRIGPMTVVEKGMSQGERVVTSSLLKLFPGTKVTIISEEQFQAGPVSPKPASDAASSQGKAAN